MSAAHRIECPRCGYDLHGVVETWECSCPTSGSCSECGLPFAWRDLLNPSYRLPRWCVEADRSVLAWPAQIVGTLTRAVVPWRYWSMIALQQPIRWRRLVAMWATFLLTLVPSAIVATAAVAVVDHRDALRLGSSADTSADVFLHTCLKPWSRQPATTYVSRGWRYPGPTPLEHNTYLWLDQWQVIVLALVAPGTTALAFAALPQSRRRAKVRARHVLRVALHGTVVPFVVLALAGLASLVSAVESPPAAEANALHLLAWLLLPLGTLFWWDGAIRRYLRMEHAIAVALSTTVIGLLLPISVLGLVWYLFDTGPV